MNLESINLVEFLLGLLFSLILPDPKEFNVWIRGILVFSLGGVLPYLCYQEPQACMSLWPFNLFFDFFHQELQIKDPYITLLFLSFLVSFLLGCFTALYGLLHLISNQWQFFDHIHLALPIHLSSLFGSSHNQPVRKKIKPKKKKRRNLRVAIVIGLWLCLMLIIFRQETFNLMSYLYIYLNSSPSTTIQPANTSSEQSPSWNWIAFLDLLTVSKDGQVVEEQIVEIGPAPKKKKKERPIFEDDDDDNIPEFDEFDWDEEDTETEKMQAKKKLEEKAKKKQEKEIKKNSKAIETASRNQLAKEQFLAWLKEHRKTNAFWTWLNPAERPDVYYSLWAGSGALSIMFCFCVWKIYRIQERQDMEARKAGQMQHQQQQANTNTKSNNRKNTKNSGNLTNSNQGSKSDNGAGMGQNSHSNGVNNNNNSSNNGNHNGQNAESSGSKSKKKKRKQLSSSDSQLQTKPTNKNYPV